MKEIPYPNLVRPVAGVTVVRRIRGKGDTLLRVNIEHAFRRYITVVFPLLIVAATIETALILKMG